MMHAARAEEEILPIIKRPTVKEILSRAWRAAKTDKKGDSWGWFFIGPAIMLFLVFQFWPLFRGMLMAFSDYRALDPSTHGIFNLNGLDNYFEIVRDKGFISALGVTLRYTALYTPLLLVISLSVALLISKVKNALAAAFYRVVAYIPVVLPISVSMALWRQLYNHEYGYLNQFLRMIGIAEPPYWMALPELAYWTILMPDLWLGFGYYTFLFLIGLYNIDTTLYEAADVDGAGSWIKFRRITLPLLKPVMTLVLVNQAALGAGTMAAMTMFGDAAPGGPGQSMMTVGLYTIITAFGQGDLRMGYGAAMGLVMSVISMILSVIIFKSLWSERD
jgi:ABC-type sugar transport system permease subunit